MKHYKYLKYFTIHHGSLVYTGPAPATRKEAFKISLAKWWILTRPETYTFNLISEGAQDTCGLCMKYYEHNCIRCPIYLDTGHETCEGNTFYTEFSAELQSDHNLSVLLDYANDEYYYILRMAKIYYPNYPWEDLQKYILFD